VTPIHLLANETSWDDRRDQLIAGGQADRYLGPILAALPGELAQIRRHPIPGPYVNVYMNHRATYREDSWRGERASVLISHGIASKGYRNGARALAFSHVTVPGPSLYEEVLRSRVPKERVHQLGYPKLDPIHNGRIESPWPERDGRIRVLWAPTHGGGSERHRDGNPNAPGAKATSWWHRDDLLALLDPDRFLIVEAPHPRHSKGRRATLPQYVGADVCIADGGSTIYEAWCCGIPVALPRWLVGERNLTRAGGTTQEARVYRERIGWHADRPEELAEQVQAAAEHGMTDQEIEFAEQVLPTAVRGHGGKLHAEFLLDLEKSTRPIPRPRRVWNGPAMKFFSPKYPQLQVPRARVRFRDGVVVTRNPDAIAELLKSQYRDLGVVAAPETVEPAGGLAESAPAEGAREPQPTGADLGDPEDDPADGSDEGGDDSAADDPAPKDLADGSEVPAGGAKEILGWVGDDPDRARRALDAEQARDKPRSTLVSTLTKVAG
jgi:hypothetical protein